MKKGYKEGGVSL